MFGCKPLLPIDIEFGVNTPNVPDVLSAKCVAKIQKWMKWAFQQVKMYNEKEINCAKKHYDQNVRCLVLASGHLVLIRIKAFKEKYKVLD